MKTTVIVMELEATWKKKRTLFVWWNVLSAKIFTDDVANVNFSSLDYLLYVLIMFIWIDIGKKKTTFK